MTLSSITLFLILFGSNLVSAALVAAIFSKEIIQVSEKGNKYSLLKTITQTEVETEYGKSEKLICHH